MTALQTLNLHRKILRPIALLRPRREELARAEELEVLANPGTRPVARLARERAAVKEPALALAERSPTSVRLS